MATIDFVQGALLGQGIPKEMERVRWEFEIEKNHWADAEYKINNSLVAYYARIFAIKHPEHRDYFDFREVRGVSEQ